MIKVALVTNWSDTCGIAEYARNLIRHSDPAEVKFRVVIPPFSLQRIMKASEDVDVVHFNYVTKFDGLNWLLLRSMSKPWIITLHESSQGNVDQLLGTYVPNSRCMFDCVITHERFVGTTYIPMGFAPVDTRDVKVRHKLGFAGFPFPWKGFYQAAKAASYNHMGFLAVIPESHHVNAEIAEGFIKRVHPQAEIIRSWLDYEEVVRKLASCRILAFPYMVDYDGEYAKAWPTELIRISQLHGISGALRMGIAAKRPLIVTHHCQFRDLYDYKDEVYFVEDTLERTVARVLQDIEYGEERLPKRILQDMNWTRCASLYLEQYRKLSAQQKESGVCAEVV